jgi:hypothetical protein
MSSTSPRRWPVVSRAADWSDGRGCRCGEHVDPEADIHAEQRTIHAALAAELIQPPSPPLRR